MKTIALIWVISALAAASALAGDNDNDKYCKDKNCHPPREVCFNVFCTYDEDRVKIEDNHHPRFDRCHAGSTFMKWVTDDGDEIKDISLDRNDLAKFQVECDGKTIYNNSAHRYTDWQGTRIQAL